MTTQPNGLGIAMRGLGKLFGVGATDRSEAADDMVTRGRLASIAPVPPRAIAGTSRAEEAAIEIERYRAILANVSAFLLEHAIEPLPDHYALAYRHRIAGEPGLGTQVADLIRDGSTMIEAMREDEGALSIALLATLVKQAQQQLAEVAALARRSGDDARQYGQSLDENISELAPAIASHPVLGSLVGLTRMMIEKTSAAEALMRESASQMDGMRNSLDQAREQAETDVLTGVSNRRAFERMLGAATERAVSQGAPLSIAFCDIDRFKDVNDTHGHDIGDRVLTFVARLLAENIGSRGNVARHGGEEFVMLFEGLAPEEAFEVVDAARFDLSKRNIIDRNGGQHIGSITISAGIAGLAPDANISNMLRRADRALYRAKRGGRNLVLLADPDPNSVNNERPLP